MLYMHGETLLARKSLNLIPITPRDNVSDKWKGVQHGQLATAIIKRSRAAGLVVEKEGWYTNGQKTGNKSDLFGAVDFSLDSPKMQELGIELKIGQDANFSLGVRHSNAGKYAVSFVVGARIGVCANGVFSGDFILKHKHTQDLNLDELIDDGIQTYLRECQTLNHLIGSYQDTEIDDRDASYMILNTPTNHMAFQYLEKVRDNWVNPPHEEFAPRTAWSLYNAFTEVAKELTPPRQLRILAGIKGRFDEFISNN